MQSNVLNDPKIGLLKMEMTTKTHDVSLIVRCSDLSLSGDSSQTVGVNDVPPEGDLRRL